MLLHQGHVIVKARRGRDRRALAELDEEPPIGHRPVQAGTARHVLQAGVHEGGHVAIEALSVDDKVRWHVATEALPVGNLHGPVERESRAHERVDRPRPLGQVMDRPFIGGDAAIHRVGVHQPPPREFLGDRTWDCVGDHDGHDVRDARRGARPQPAGRQSRGRVHGHIDLYTPVAHRS